MKKRVWSVITALTMTAALLSGCGGKNAEAANTQASQTTAVGSKEQGEGGQNAEIVLKYAELNSEEHPMAQGAVKFADLVSEKSGGRIRIDLYFSGTLGDEKTCMQGVQIGTIDLFRANTNNMADYGCSIMNALALPYVFRDLDHLSSTLRNDIGKELLDSVQSSGTQMVALSYMEEGPRNLFFTNKSVTKLSDLKGLKIRVPETEVMIKTMKALGANPTPISYSELYTSLQTGVVDAAENAVTGYVTNSFFEVAPYYVKDAHTFGPGLIVMSEKSFNKLSAEDQGIIREAAVEAQDYVLELTKEIEDQYYKDLDEKGIHVLEVEDIENWSAAVKDVYQDYGTEVADLISKIQAQ